MLMHPFFFLFYFHWVIGTLVTVIMNSKLATLTPNGSLYTAVVLFFFSKTSASAEREKEK